MLREQVKFLNKLSIIADILVIVFSFYLAYLLRRQLASLNEPYNYFWILLIIIPTWYFIMAKFGLYQSMRTHSPFSIILILAKVNVIGGVTTASAIYLLEPAGYSRGLYVLFLSICFMNLSIEKLLFKLGLGFIRRRGFNTRNILLVGTQQKTRDFAKLIERHANWGLSILGLVRLDDELPERGSEDYPVLGELGAIVDVCRSHTVDEVVFCLPKERLAEVETILGDMEEMGVTVRMVLDIYDMPRTKKELSLFHGEIPILTFYCRAFDANHLFIKRCLDILGATVGLCLTGILFPVIYIAIKIDSPGPLLFGQQRVGERGRIFTCWKFRSMYVDAEKRKKELMHLNEMNGAIFKIKDDPRVTRIGRFLRKTSLDEMPQFWNVLVGEMSLVGTRPPTPDEVSNYENWHCKRICIKPGMTGLWQVSGRNKVHDFHEVAKLDIAYIENWSLWLDIKIILKTLWVVFSRNGS